MTFDQFSLKQSRWPFTYLWAILHADMSAGHSHTMTLTMTMKCVCITWLTGEQLRKHWTGAVSDSDLAKFIPGWQLIGQWWDQKQTHSRIIRYLGIESGKGDPSHFLLKRSFQRQQQSWTSAPGYDSFSQSIKSKLKLSVNPHHPQHSSLYWG